MHVHGSVFAQYLTSKVVLDIRDNDVYWCTADPGWVTGTSYGIIGRGRSATQWSSTPGSRATAGYETIEKHASRSGTTRGRRPSAC